MNKAQLIEALAIRFGGNRKAAAKALESVLDTISREVAKGEKVVITGFGSFERRVREARWVRNPQTGARIKAKKTAVPKFSAGADLKNVVSGAKQLPTLTLADSTSAAETAGSGRARKAASAATPGSSSTRKTTAKKSAPAKKATAKKSAPAKKATAKKSAPAKKATAKKSAPAKKATAKKSAPAKKATAKKTPTKSSPRRPKPGTPSTGPQSRG